MGNFAAHRAQTDVQYFFINGRVIKDRIINHAIRQAYGDALPAGRQAAYVLYLTLPLDRVDVNVHPTKHEVRFRDARLVHGLITRAVQEALTQDEHGVVSQSELPLPKPENTSAVKESSQNYQPHPVSQTLTTATPPSSVSASESDFVLLHQRYVLLTSPEPIVLDLQEAALLFKRKQFLDAVDNKTLASRPILVPLNIPLASDALALFNHHHALLKELALEFTVNADAITVKRIPFLLSHIDLQTIVATVVTALQSQQDHRLNLIKQLSGLFEQANITTEQARQIMAQHSIDELKQTGSYRKLDQTTLTSLFSN